VVNMKNAVFWDVAPSRYCVNRRFGGTYHVRLQCIITPQAMNQRDCRLCIFWDVTPSRYFVNRRFVGTFRLHLQGIRNPRAMNQLDCRVCRVYRHLLTLVHRSRIFYPEMEAILSSETSVSKISTRRHIPEDGILRASFILTDFLL
jgi:hypothetical protein